MAFAANTLKQRVSTRKGPGGQTIVECIAQFSGADASATFDLLVPRVNHVTQPAPIGPVATDEALYWDMLANVVDGQIVRPASGLGTITRTGAAKTAGLWIMFSYQGN